MDPFYFHTKKTRTRGEKKTTPAKREQHKTLHGMVVFWCYQFRQNKKIKPINVMGISRRFAFIPFLLPSPSIAFLPCHCAFHSHSLGEGGTPFFLLYVSFLSLNSVELELNKKKEKFLSLSATTKRRKCIYDIFSVLKMALLWER